MVTSSADVFRARQTLADLIALAEAAPLSTWTRIAAGRPAAGGSAPADGLRRHLLARRCRLDLPREDGLHSTLLLAAALPDEDFPAFVTATAVLLADLLQGAAGRDDLFWNWEAFHEHYAMAGNRQRAAIANGFRMLHLSGRVTLDPAPDPALCLRRDAAAVLNLLEGTGLGGLSRAVATDAPPRVAGRLWQCAARRPLPAPALAAFRYLAERPAGLAPPDPETAPLLPWRG